MVLLRTFLPLPLQTAGFFFQRFVFGKGFAGCVVRLHRFVYLLSGFLNAALRRILSFRKERRAAFFIPQL